METPLDEVYSHCGMHMRLTPQDEANHKFQSRAAVKNDDEQNVKFTFTNFFLRKWQSPVNVINMLFGEITNQFNEGIGIGVMATIALAFNHIIKSLWGVTGIDLTQSGEFCGRLDIKQSRFKAGQS